MVDLSFNFNGLCWLWPREKAAWHFIRLPQEKSEEIKFLNEHLHEKTRLGRSAGEFHERQNHLANFHFS